MPKSITEKLWTRLTPWTVAVSPLEDDSMPEVLEFMYSNDAERCVTDHNEALHMQRRGIA